MATLTLSLAIITAICAECIPMLIIGMIATVACGLVSIKMADKPCRKKSMKNKKRPLTKAVGVQKN